MPEKFENQASGGYKTEVRENVQLACKIKAKAYLCFCFQIIPIFKFSGVPFFAITLPAI